MRIIQDTPLCDIKKDRLGREPMVDLIVESIKHLTSTSHPCTVYGIYGKWGEGKTSLLNFIKKKLEKQGKKDGINLVEFNPWLVSNDEALLREFFKTIMDKSSCGLKWAFKKYGALAILASKTIINTVKPGFGTLLFKVGSWVNNIFSGNEKTLNELKSKVSKRIKKAKHHFVVMIDDVDRLDREELHTLLRLIRQVADFENCIYIVAMDVEMVAKSIGSYHGEGFPIDGRKFLDKIVQVPITLPQIPDRIIRTLIQEELSSTLSGYVEENELESVANSVTPFISTYRELKRYCNQISFVLPHLKDEVNIKELCLLECIKIVNAESYRRIIENRSSLMHEVSDVDFYEDKDKELAEVEKRYKNARDIISQDNDARIRAAIDIVIDELFRGNSINYQEDLDKKRLRTDVYFSKYFTMTVPSELIPDRELDSFKSNCQNMSIEAISQQFDSWVDKYSDSEVERAVLYVIRKIKYGHERCETTSIMVQALSTCKLAKGLPPRTDVSPGVISSFVPQVIYRYMFVRDENYATMNVWDADLLDKALFYIFSNAELNYCLNFLCSADSIFRNGTYNGSRVLLTLIHRFKVLSIEEQFGYSRFLLRTMLEYWKRVDENSFDEYASNLFTNSDISCQMVFNKFLEEPIDDEDVDRFVSLFMLQIPQINDRLSKESEDVQNSKSVRLYISNYQLILKDLPAGFKQ